jgi:membrane protein
MNVRGGRLKSVVRGAAAAARGYSREVWGRDRAALGGWSALWTRLARITTWSIRGVLVHKLSLQAAALAYYTLFSIVPVLVVVLWALKLFHLLPYLKADLPGSAASPGAGGYFPTANVFLRTAVQAILAAVDRAGKLQAGIVGLAALLYGVIKQLVHVERAIDTIAGASSRPPRYRRMLGYLALLVLPPVLVLVSGLLRGLSRLPLGSHCARAVSWLLASVPLLKSALGVGLGLVIGSLALALFYSSAARARIAPWSAVFGGTLGAVLLAAVLWAFARLQIGASHVGALESGMAAVPVFLLWSFSSWMVILIGAQVAVAHELDGVLVHGARALQLDPYDEQVAAVQIMIEAAKRESTTTEAALTADEVARRLRVLPATIRDLAARLQRAGLLRRKETGALGLACDPDRTSLRDVVNAVIGRPGGGAGKRTGPTLHELVEKEAVSRSRRATYAAGAVRLSPE